MTERAGVIGFLPTGRDYPPSYRDNDRIVLDDEALAALLFRRIASRVPAVVDGKRLVRLNPRFRLCRYRDGQKFAVHQDGSYRPRAGGAVREASLLTCQISLSDPCDFAGGHTRFYASRMGPLVAAMRPPCGSAIVFGHDFWHDGEAVHEGTKIVLRTDVVYESSAPGDVEHGEDRGYVFAALPLVDGRVAVGSRDCTVRVESATSDALVFGGHRAAVTCLTQIVPGLVLSGSRDRSVRCNDLATGTDEMLLRHDGAVLAVVALRHPRAGITRFVSSGADGVLALANLDGRCERVPAHDGWVWALAETHEGTLASGSEDGTVAVWDVAHAKLLERIDLGAAVRCLASVGKASLVAGLANGELVVLRVSAARATVERRFAAHDGAVNAICAAGTDVVSGGDDGVVRRIHLRGHVHSEVRVGRSVRTVQPLAAYDGGNAQFMAGGYGPNGSGMLQTITLTRRARGVSKKTEKG